MPFLAADLIVGSSDSFGRLTMTSPFVPYSRRDVLHAAAGLGALLGVDLAGLGQRGPATSAGLSHDARTAMAGPFAWVARHDLTADQFQAEWNRLAGLGYRPTHVDGYTVAGQARYAGIWEQAPGPPLIAKHGLTSAQYQAEFTRVTGLGYRPVVVSGYEIGGQAHFAAIWEQTGGPPWVARHDLTSAQYQAEFDRLLGLGYRLVLVDGYQVGGQARFAAIWEQTAGPAWVGRHNLTAAQYQAEFTSLTNQGYRPVHVSGYLVAAPSCSRRSSHTATVPSGRPGTVSTPPPTRPPSTITCAVATGRSR